MSRLGKLGVALLVILASGVCVGLGYWQWNRHTARAAAVNLITTNLDAEPVEITELLGADLLTPLDGEDVWHPVTVTGTWVPASGVQLRNRPVDGANASHSLALLRTDQGTLLVVDRGWWRQTDVVPDGALDTPGGQVELVVRMRLAEPPDERTPPAGEVYRIVPEQVVAEGFDQSPPPEVTESALVTSAYGIVESPAPGDPLHLLPDPGTSLRSHLSYAFQWWFFAAAIPVAGVILARRDREDSEGEDSPKPERRRRGPTLEEEEDALLDAQEDGRNATV